MLTTSALLPGISNRISGQMASPLAAETVPPLAWSMVVPLSAVRTIRSLSPVMPVSLPVPPVSLKVPVQEPGSPSQLNSA